MRKHLLAAALSAACASGAWAQQNNERVFTSGPGVGYTVRNGSPVPANTPFTINGFSIVGSPGASLSGVEAGCSGTHVHGSFFGINDPGGGGCGHGIIGLSGGATVIPGASAMLANAMPNSAAGQMAATGAATGFDAKGAGELFLTAFLGVGAGEFYANDATAIAEHRGLVLARDILDPQRQQREEASEALTRQIYAEEERRRRASPEGQKEMENLAKMQEERARADAAKSGAKDGQPTASILQSIAEPDIKEVLKAMNAPLPDLEKQREINNKAQEAMDAIFSGDAQKSEVARKALQFASPELLNRVGQKINERVQNIVRTSLNNAAGAPRVSSQ